ncbi:DnaJ [Trichinella spiralis]|uniref:DnaJ n=2 Tax=Trichinella spiralis TaxID=6334 RepID=A0ABR3KSG4_TRISP
MSLECDKACAVISSTTMSNPNNERILCVDHNGNIIYLSREDLQRAYDTILETAVTEYSRRMGMHTRNVRESRSVSTEMSGPLLQQQQHHQQQQQHSQQQQQQQQQHEEVSFSFSPWRCTCAPNVRFGAVPITPATHFVPIVSSSSEDMPTADEFTSQTGSLSTTAAEVERILFHDDLSSEESSSFSLSGRTYWPELEFEMDEVATSAFEFYLRQREEMLRPRRRM